jgi:hypothetical protein
MTATTSRPKGIVCAAAALLFALAGGAEAKKKHAPPPPHKRAAPAAVPEEMTPVADTPAPAAAAPSRAPSRAEAPVRGGAGGQREVVQRESKIEFDERMVQGQTASGAIYLFQRGDSEFRSMVDMPSSFRDRTVRELLPNREKP